MEDIFLLATPLHSQNFISTDDGVRLWSEDLAEAADLAIVAPATANIIGKMANGIADDFLSTELLAMTCPVVIAPAMNVRMWLHRATQRNIATLRADDIRFVGPNEGDMACGEYGPGRMAEPEEIFAAIGARLGQTGRLAGRRVIVTSGPTHEPDWCT